MQEKKLCRRFYEMAFAGLRYIKMLKNIPEHAMHASELENHPEEMIHH
jgi:hypothetical protein